MARGKRQDNLYKGILTTLRFTHPKKRPDFSQGFVVHFAVQPKVGEVIEIDQYSIRKLKHEDMCCCYWKVDDVFHQLSLEPEDDENFIASSLVVTVRPHVPASLERPTKRGGAAV